MTNPQLGDFLENVDFKNSGDRISISCKKGLWSVETVSLRKSIEYAFNYFIQYWQDGEYDGTAKAKLKLHIERKYHD